MFVNADGQAVPLQNLYRGRSAFLVCGGPSFAKMPGRVQRILKRPAFLTMAVNNAPKVFRPNLWCSVDEPDHFLRSIYLDPTIMKFQPVGKVNKALWDSDKWESMDVRVKDCPNVYYYSLTHDGYPDQFLSQPKYFWGFSGQGGGGRSVMHVAVKLLYDLGCRRIFLLGADFHMTPERGYSFEQARHAGSVKNNNDTYRKLNERFTVLRPQFEAAGLQVINCTPDSQLHSFARMPFMEAADMVQDEFGVDVVRERTFGLYERAGKEKQVAKWTKKLAEREADAKPHVEKAKVNKNPRVQERARKKMDKVRDAAEKLAAARAEVEALKNWKAKP